MCGTCRSVPASVSITVCLSWIHKSTACTYSCHVTALNSHLLAAAVRHSVALTHARKHENSPTRSELAAGVWQLHIVAEKSTQHVHTHTDTVAVCVWEGTRTTHWDSVIFDIVRFNNLNSSRLLPVNAADARPAFVCVLAVDRLRCCRGNPGRQGEDGLLCVCHCFG